MSKQTIYKYLRRYTESGEVYVGKSPGRPKKLTREQERQLADAGIANRFFTNQQLLNHVPGLQTISLQTVSRSLKKHGLSSRIAAQKTLLSSRDKAIRLELARRNVQRAPSDFAKTIFIDEFHLDSGSKGKIRVKRFAGERYSEDTVDHNNMKSNRRLTAVCSFSANGIGPIRMVFGSFNSNQYIDYLSDAVLPYARQEFGNDFFLLQDNAPIHAANIVSEFLAETIPGRLIEHPPYSPNLNPIENLGSMFKRLIRKYLKVWPVNSDFDPQTVAQIAWREIGDNSSLIQSLVGSMSQRYQSVIINNGYHTKY